MCKKYTASGQNLPKFDLLSSEPFPAEFSFPQDSRVAGRKQAQTASSFGSAGSLPIGCPAPKPIKHGVRSDRWPEVRVSNPGTQGTRNRHRTDCGFGIRLSLQVPRWLEIDPIAK